VANAAITTKIHQAFDVHRDLAPQVALNDKIGNSRSQTSDLRFRQIFYFRVRFYTGRITDLSRPRSADAIDRRQPNYDVLVQWNVYACYSSHVTPVLFCLALTLLMPFVGTDHPHNTVAPNDLAVPAHFSNRCPDFHELSPKICNKSKA
jgi:hypothetical protein